MTGPLVVSSLVQGGLVVGLIVVQAVVLYVGYAAVERIVAEPLLERTLDETR